MKNLLLSTGGALLSIFVISFVLTFIHAIGGDYSHPMISLYIAGVSTVVAAITMLVWGCPIHMILKRFELTSVYYYLLAGAVPGFVFVFVFLPFGNDPIDDLLLQSLLCGAYGSIAAACFWYISKKQKHNHSFEKDANDAHLN